jgi:hypothetical protein
MARRLACFVVLALAIPAAAQYRSGSISGQVTDSTGVPRIGAVVEVLAAAASPVLVTFTDDSGRYSTPGLAPGIYRIKVTAASYLPALRGNVSLAPGGHQVINITLNTLFDAIKLPRKQSAQDDEDWKWTLRSAANRPILRVIDPTQLARVENAEDHVTTARLSFLTGSPGEGFGSSSDVTTAFSVEHSLFSFDKVSFRGDVSGYNAGIPSTVLRAAYSHRFADGTRPEIAFTLRRFASPEFLHGGDMQSLAVSFANSTTIADFIELNYGGELQSLDFMGHVNAFRPFGSAELHLNDRTVVAYRYTTSRPTTRTDKGFDTSPADFTEADPRVSLTHSVGQLERARHHEVSVARKLTRNDTVEVAVYRDHVGNLALLGAGLADVDSGEVLPDTYSGTFTYNGGSLETRGVRVVEQHKFNHNFAVTLDYAYGGVTTLPYGFGNWNAVRQALQVEHRNSFAAKGTGEIPRTHTRWIASYRWIDGRALAPVDMFNASPGQADPYLNVFVRQPIPGTGFFPCKLEVIADIRNLLAQGYVPVLGSDGQTVYLVQNPRAIRGGLAFVF